MHTSMVGCVMKCEKNKHMNLIIEKDAFKVNMLLL